MERSPGRHLFSLVATLKLWGINPRLWLTEYLQACRAAGGQAPADLKPFLPWNRSEANAPIEGGDISSGTEQ